MSVDPARVAPSTVRQVHLGGAATQRQFGDFITRFLREGGRSNLAGFAEFSPSTHQRTMRLEPI